MTNISEEKRKIVLFGKRSTAAQVVADFDLTGKTFFITGANAGIGYETARALALRNAHVVMGCRNASKAAEARENILKEKPDAIVDVLEMDNASLNSVKRCAETYISKKWPLHCLILNAGVYNPTPRVTVDGFEATFQVNHLAHFLLTKLLTPVLLASSPSRVIIVSSEGHRGPGAMTGLRPRDVTWERFSPTDTAKMNSAMVAYTLSKLCNIWFCKSLHTRLSDKGVTVCSLHPGVINTTIQRNSATLRRFLAMPGWWRKNTEQGASTTVYCATCLDLTPERGGQYFDNCQLASPSGTARNSENAETMWLLSENMLTTFEKKQDQA